MDPQMELANKLKAEFIRRGGEGGNLVWESLAEVARSHYAAIRADEVRAKQAADAAEAERRWAARQAWEETQANNYGAGRG